MSNMSNFWYGIMILFPILGGASLIFIPFKKRVHMCIYIEAITLLTSLLVFMVLFDRPKEALELITFVSKFRISFSFDGMGSIFAGLISFLWPLATLYAFEYMSHETNENTCKETTFFCFYVMTFGITLGIASATNVLTMYVFYEMLTLVTIPLIIFSLSRDAILATRLYIYYSLGGAAFGFITIVFLSNFGSSLDFVLGGILTANGFTNANLLRLIYIFGFFGFGVKAAIFPLCTWLPKAGVAPTPVTALLHAVAVVKSGAFAILRITYFSFGTEILKDSFAQYIPLAFAAFTIVYGCSQAVRERHLKRRLAYSTVANLSYILFGALLMTPMGMTGSLLHMLFHGVMKIAAFFCAGAIISKTGMEYVFEIEGLAKRMPVTFFTFLISSLAIMGVPGLCGFISKWYLAKAAVQSHGMIAYLGIAALMISALLTAIYMLQIVVKGYFPGKNYSDGSTKSFHDPGFQMVIPFIIFIIVMLLFGLFPGKLVDLVTAVSTGAF